MLVTNSNIRWCRYCRVNEVHRQHYFDGCTCLSPGGVFHSSLCDLYGLNFRWDDSLLLVDESL